MKRYLQIACFVAILVGTSVTVVADDSFLSRQLPTTWVCYNTPEQLLQVLRSVVPKPLLLPEGMSISEGMPARKPLLNPTEAEKARAGTGALFGRVPGDKTPFTIRDYLDLGAGILGMTWNYASGRDAVVFDFPWHVSDRRSNAELISILCTNTPPEDEKHVYSSIIDRKHDLWRPAFNALLSKPGNYAEAWQVRWKMEGSFPGIRQPTNLFTGTILDDTQTAQLLILNIQGPTFFTSGAVSTIGFYLFSPTGELEHAGLFYAQDGHGRKVQVEVDPGRNRLFIHNGINPSYNRYDQIFAVKKNRFRFEERRAYGNPNAPYPPFKVLFEIEGS